MALEANAMRRALTLTAACFMFAGAARAQNVTVQQPVMSSFSVNTTISAPDSGGLLIGGVGSATLASARYGPLPLGTNSGIFGVGGSMTVHPTIHHLEELDREVLAAARRRAKNSEVVLPGNAESAWRALATRAASKDREGEPQSRRLGAAESIGRGTGRPAEVRAPMAADDDASSTRRLVRLGQQAEAEGKREVALAFYRTAGKRGSREAHELLARLRGAR
jgi:hypothetical protein